MIDANVNAYKDSLRMVIKHNQYAGLMEIERIRTRHVLKNKNKDVENFEVGYGE